MRTTADTSRDQAERYLFTALPLLPRAERRALALAELVDDNRMVAEGRHGALVGSGFYMYEHDHDHDH